MGQLPAELALDQLDGGGRRRRSGREQPNAARRTGAHLRRRVGDADQHGRRRAEHGDALVLDQLVDQLRLDAPQAHVGHAARGVDPGERPAVGVEHRQRPQIAIGRRQVMMHERAHDVHVGVAMRDHHALGPRRRAARVVDGEQVGLGDVRSLEPGLVTGERRLVVDPALGRPFQRNEVLDTLQLAANALDGLDVVAVRADDLRAAMVDDVVEIVGQQAIVDRHQHRADLRHGVVGFEMRVRIGGDVGDAIALPDAHRLQGRRPAVAALEELRVGQSQVAIDDGLAVGIEPTGASREFHRRQRDFHWTAPPGHFRSFNERPCRLGLLSAYLSKSPLLAQNPPSGPCVLSRRPSTYAILSMA